MNTGYSVAEDWLRATNPEWRIRWSDATLVTSPFAGLPPGERVEVTLVRPGQETVELRGEGSTHLEAVQRAIGALQE